MLPKPLTLERFAEICRDLILKGWMPCGKLGEMLFEHEGKVYDLSTANLDMLDYIKNKTICVAYEWQIKERENAMKTAKKISKK